MNDLEDDDLCFKFDIKGSIYGRKVLENPRDILNTEVVIKNRNELSSSVLKDQDFLQSFKKLDITQVQSERILSQLENDIEVLSKHGIMDYSLYLIVVIKPYKNVSF